MTRAAAPEGAAVPTAGLAAGTSALASAGAAFAPWRRPPVLPPSEFAAPSTLRSCKRLPGRNEAIVRTFKPGNHGKRESSVMKRHVNVCRLGRAPRSSQAAQCGPTPSIGRNETADAAPTLRSRSLLALAGAAVVLLGCQQDPGGTAPGDIEPSASSQQSDTSPSGGPSGTTGPQSNVPESDAGGEDDPGDEGDAGGGSSGTN